MWPIILEYFDYFFHPFKIHESQSKTREVHLMPFSQSLLLSWFYFIIGMIFSMYFLYLEFHFFKLSSLDSLLMQDMLRFSELSGYEVTIILFFIAVTFYPLYQLISSFWWYLVIRFFSEMTIEESQNPSENETIHQRVMNILTVSLSSSQAYLVPVFGKFIQSVTFTIQLFAGLKHQLGFGTGASLIVLLAPSVFMVLVLSFFMFVILFVLS